WVIQLGTEDAQALVLTADTLSRIARTDSSPTVRLAIASVVPSLPLAERWRVTAALAVHAEDAADRFLPKMVWFALAPTVAADVPRALDLAARTPLPTLADSILWFAARTLAGREEIATRLALSNGRPETGAVRMLRVFAFALESEAG